MSCRKQQRGQALPAQPQGRPAVLRAAITRLETVPPLLNTLSSLVLTIPLERRGAAMEIEAVDPKTPAPARGLDARLARTRDGIHATFRQAGGGGNRCSQGCHRLCAAAASRARCREADRTALGILR